MGRGAGEIGPAIAAGGQDDELGAEPMQGAIVELPGGDALAGPVVHDQVKGEILDEKLHRVAQGLAIEGVQNRVAGAVGGGAGALDRPFTIVLGHAAKGALIDAALIGAGKGHTPVF